MKRRRQVAAFILVGGKSSRMGRDKGLLDFGGVPLILHTARLIEPLVASVTVVGEPRRFRGMGLRALDDPGVDGKASKRARRGPLAGIAAALAATRSSWNLIVACDLPYLSQAWLDWLLSRAVESRAQLVVPRTSRGLEPLAAVYRRECGAAIAGALAGGARKVTDVIEELRLDVVQEREWRRLDPRALVLKNMNTPADYDEALRWWGRGRENGAEPEKETPRSPQGRAARDPRKSK